MPPSHTSLLMSLSLSNTLGMPAYVLCQGMEGLGVPLHAEDEVALLDEAKARVRPPGLAVGCTDMRHMWETTGSGMRVMEEGAASVWKGLNFPEGACHVASLLWSARWRHCCDTHDVLLAPLLLEAGVLLGRWVRIAGSSGWLAARSTGGGMVSYCTGLQKDAGRRVTCKRVA